MIHSIFHHSFAWRQFYLQKFNALLFFLRVRMHQISTLSKTCLKKLLSLLSLAQKWQVCKFVHAFTYDLSRSCAPVRPNMYSKLLNLGGIVENRFLPPPLKCDVDSGEIWCFRREVVVYTFSALFLLGDESIYKKICFSCLNETNWQRIVGKTLYHLHSSDLVFLQVCIRRNKVIS